MSKKYVVWRIHIAVITEAIKYIIYNVSEALINTFIMSACFSCYEVIKTRHFDSNIKINPV